MPRRVGRFLVMSVVQPVKPIPEEGHIEGKGESGKLKGRNRMKHTPSPKKIKIAAVQKPSQFSARDQRELNQMTKDIEAKDLDLLPDLVPSKAIRMKQLIGQGAFGEVYKGILYGQEVAIKKLKSYNRAEIMGEVRVMQTLRHPNIVEYLGVTLSPDNSISIVAEFLGGGTLADLLSAERKANQKLRMRRILVILQDISRGLSWLHYRRIIHRDLKPSNILLDKFGRCKISDFGLAHCKETTKVGGHYGVCGTLTYAAPEVLDEREYGYAADVFSFSIIAAELCSGRYPLEHHFLNKGRDEVLRKNFQAAIIKGARPKLPERVPPKLVQMLQACWQEDPMKRPDAISAFETVCEVESDWLEVDPVEKIKDLIGMLPKGITKIFEEQMEKNQHLEDELKATKEKLIRVEAEAAELRAKVERMAITSIPVSAAAKAATTQGSPKLDVAKAALTLANTPRRKVSPVVACPHYNGMADDKLNARTPQPRPIHIAPSVIPVVIVGRPRSGSNTEDEESKAPVTQAMVEAVTTAAAAVQTA
mmetsp:Transcript_25060/g.34924  ORF Transcript_25060/g.34924 Transcript_25060/m.34924 type:complete len:535 (-) Transcript_25060:366-1970(-)|eukprot:CAMPEP_0184489994 /NCGR_PEP_ID=MMETSP0113_2-20130426/16860_1 /TAXON_ID=91329 /ORGANISM="Norrisiella sphaerica, Strain BC52" /LENGTH=534 /DNA_ID=CAMNT_0026873707 /DNA_START=219 /DNA_END=1823 /DNA_ORIENTATION=-